MWFSWSSAMSHWKKRRENRWTHKHEDFKFPLNEDLSLLCSSSYPLLNPLD